MIIGIDASSAVSSQWGGPENYSYYLIRELVNLDQQNQYRLYINQDPPRPLPQLPNVKLVKFSLPRLWTHLGLAVRTYTDPIDLLFSPAHTLPLITRPGLPAVFTVHDLASRFLRQYYNLPGRIYLNSMTAYSARKADQVLAVSVSTKRDLVEELGLEDKKVTVVYNGYSPQQFHPVPPEEVDQVLSTYGLARPYFLAVGTIQPRKNYARLIEAFSRVVRLCGNSSRPYSGISLAIAGKPGWQCGDAYSAPSRFGVADRVSFLGHIQDKEVPALMSGAVALLYPSLYEGFGLVALEALACGTVVLTSNISSLPEAVGEAGILIDPYNVGGITRGILNILEMSEQEREKLINSGLKRVSGFTWKKAAKKTLQVLESVYYKKHR